MGLNCNNKHGLWIRVVLLKQAPLRAVFTKLVIDLSAISRPHLEDTQGESFSCVTSAISRLQQPYCHGSENRAWALHVPHVLGRGDLIYNNGVSCSAPIRYQLWFCKGRVENGPEWYHHSCAGPNCTVHQPTLAIRLQTTPRTHIQLTFCLR